MQNYRKVSPTRDLREVPPFDHIKFDLGIPGEARFVGWYINRTSNPGWFISNKFNKEEPVNKALITCRVEQAKVFKLGEYQKALEYVDSLNFDATVSVVFAYVVQSESIPGNTIDRAVIDPKSTEYLMFSMMALYDNRKQVSPKN